MLRKVFFILFALVLCVTAAGITAFGEEVKPTITMADMDVEYSPEGFTPQADAGEYQRRVKYTVVDTATGEQVDIPVNKVGRFTVHAYIEQGESNYLASCTATLNVRKAQLYVSVINPVVAHTAMENPVVYTIGPEWAAEYANISVEYTALKDMSDVGTPCGIPKAPGLYLAYFYGDVSNENVEFSGKYLVYEIAERNGSAVSEEEARKSVPSFVRANIRSVTVSYSGKAVEPECSINTPCVNYRLMYGRAYANGSVGSFSEEVPVEPGDYTVNCYVLNTVVGSGRLVVDKISPDIYLQDDTVLYRPEGYPEPTAFGGDAGIALTYSAYEYIDGKAGKSVAFPLKDCGTYLVTACPEDTAHYVYDVVHCVFTVKPVQSVISGENLVTIADGERKSPNVTVTPDFADYNISYYAVSDGKTQLLSDAPTEAGEYFAVVAVKGSEKVISSTAVYGIFIEQARESFLARFFKFLCIGVSVAALGVGFMEFVLVKRRNRSKI